MVRLKPYNSPGARSEPAPDPDSPGFPLEKVKELKTQAKQLRLLIENAAWMEDGYQWYLCMLNTEPGNEEEKQMASALKKTENQLKHLKKAINRYLSEVKEASKWSD